MMGIFVESMIMRETDFSYYLGYEAQKSIHSIHIFDWIDFRFEYFPRRTDSCGWRSTVDLSPDRIRVRVRSQLGGQGLTVKRTFRNLQSQNCVWKMEIIKKSYNLQGVFFWPWFTSRIILSELRSFQRHYFKFSTPKQFHKSLIL